MGKGHGMTTEVWEDGGVGDGRMGWGLMYGGGSNVIKGLRG